MAAPGSALAVTPETVAGAALIALLAAAAVVWVLRQGRDRRCVGSVVDQVFGTHGGVDERVPLVRGEVTPVEFAPPDGIRPAQMGVLVDFRAGPRDVTATIVDLAVRGYLQIVMAQDAGTSENDWKLVRSRSSADDAELLPYERGLLDAVFKGVDEVRRRDLRLIAGSRMVGFQRAIVDDAMAAGWFAERPDTRRKKFSQRGTAIIMVGLLLTWFLGQETEDGAMLGIPVVVAGFLVQLGGLFAPRRTAKGYALLRRVEGFRRFIVESEGPRAKLAGRAGMFSEYLGYAVVFGATERWARAFDASSATLDTSLWFGSLGPLDAEGLVRTLGSFVSSTTGTLASRRPA